MKCALITGSSKGIGKQIAIQLAKDHGYHILVHYNRDQDGANDTLNEIESLGKSGHVLTFDVTNESDTLNCLDQWRQQNPEHHIEVLVNNAGVIDDELFIWMKKAQWDRVISTTLDGFFNTTQAVIKYMIKKRYGRIINISSITGLKGVPGQSNYAAAKAGLIGATRSLALEVAKRNVTVNAIAPGFIETDMTSHLEKDQFLKLIPMKRMGSTQEVAALASFLASAQSSYITGEVINISGGLHC